jgi:hypothetical protein
MKDFSGLWKSIAKVKFPDPGLCYDYYSEIKEGAGKW